MGAAKGPILPDVEKMEIENDIEGLRKALGSEDFEKVLSAVDALKNLGDDSAVPSLLELLSSHRWYLRRKAAGALLELGWKPSNDREKALFQFAVKDWFVLNSDNEEIIKVLIDGLEDEDTHIKVHCAEILAIQKIKKAVPALQKILEGKDRIAAAAAAEALGKIKDKDSSCSLEKAAKLAGGYVRRKSAEALKAMELVVPPPSTVETKKRTKLILDTGAEEIRPKKAVPVEKPLMPKPTAFIRPASVTRMPEKDVREEQKKKPLPAVSDKKEAAEENPAVLLKNNQWNDLLKLGEKSVPVLAEALENEDDAIRRKATMALGRIGTKDAVNPLINKFTDDNWDIRRIATGALVKIGFDAVYPLMKAAGDKNKDVRSRALEALGQIGDRRALDSVEAALFDKEPYVRSVAEEALRKLTSSTPNPLSVAIKKKSRQSHQPTEEKAKEKPAYLKDVKKIVITDRTAEKKETPKEETEEKVSPTAEEYFKFKDWEGLISLGDEAVPLLERILTREKNDNLRMKAAVSLGKIGGGKALELLEKALIDRANYVRLAAAKSLGAIGGEKSIKDLIRLFDDEDWNVRRAASKALLGTGDKALPQLLKALNDKKADVRRMAAETLGEAGDSTAAADLCKALEDEDRNVRKAAAESLRKLGWICGCGPEKACFLYAQGKWEDLIKLGAIAADSLIRALEDEHENLKDRGRAARALGKIKTPQALEALIKALKFEESYIRGRAAMALGELKNPEALPHLFIALEDEDWSVAVKTAEALASINDSRAVTPLLRALSEGHRELRRKAAEILGGIGDEKIIEPLAQALTGEEDPEVQRLITSALTRIEIETGDKGENEEDDAVPLEKDQ